MLEHLPSICEALGSMPRQRRGREEGRKKLGSMPSKGREGEKEERKGKATLIHFESLPPSVPDIKHPSMKNKTRK